MVLCDKLALQPSELYGRISELAALLPDMTDRLERAKVRAIFFHRFVTYVLSIL